MSKVIFRNSAVTKTIDSFTYHGNGYQYTVKVDPVDDCAIAYLQIAQSKLDAFYAAVGKANSLHLHGIRVVRIGGWTRVIALRETTNDMVMKFLRRLNGWVLMQAAPKTFTQSRNRYTVEVPKHFNKVPPQSMHTQKSGVDLSRLLAAKDRLRPMLAPINR